MRSRTSDRLVTKKLHCEAKALLHKTVSASRRSLGAEHPGNLASVKSTCPGDSPPKQFMGKTDAVTAAQVPPSGRPEPYVRAGAAGVDVWLGTRCGKVS